MEHAFSARTRRAALEAMAAETVDVLVIGGGITGAGIARDAAMRGLRTALVDAGDFGAGTSSVSSRLIHGGLRYLEQGWLRLVFEASRERRILLRIAPHLVHPRAFTFPVHRGSRVKRWQISAGVLLYDALALFGNVHRARLLGRNGVLREEPLLRDQDLTGGAQYWDAQCDDARLVLANARSAHDHGALVASYARATQLTLAGGKLRGADIADVLDGSRRAVRAHTVINATGPWSDDVRRLDDPAAAPALRPSKGAHIVVPKVRMGNVGAVTLLSPIDGRVMFVLPWGDATIVGTTDTDAAPGDTPDTIEADEADVTYLLRSANAVFPHARLTTADVLATYAGLRPLLAAAAHTTVSVPREHEIAESKSGLITIAGGKLTTYRVMAQQAVDAAVRLLRRQDGRREPPAAATDREPLPGGDVADIAQLAAELVKEGLPTVDATRLVHTYGTEAPAVMNLRAREPALAERIAPGAAWTGADVVYQARREMALTVEDVLIRRTRAFYLDKENGVDAAPRVAELLAAELGWSDAAARASLDGYRAKVERMRRGFAGAAVR